MRRSHIVLLVTGLFAIWACDPVNNLMADLNLPQVTAKSSRSEAFLVNSECPDVEIVEDLSAYYDFTDPKEPSRDDLISRVHLTQAESSCEYTKKSVTVDLKIAFEGVLGPQGRQTENDKPFFSYPFFIAVIAPNGEILAKEVFSASMTYPTQKDTQIYFESLRQIIPIPAIRQGKRFKILIGFQLVEDQLSYNRSLLQRNKGEDELFDRTSPPKPKIERQSPLEAIPQSASTKNPSDLNESAPIILQKQQ